MGIVFVNAVGVGDVLGPLVCHARLEQYLLICFPLSYHCSRRSVGLCTRGFMLFDSLQQDA